MRELEEYTAEVRSRVAAAGVREVAVRTRRQHRLRVLGICLPLVACVILGALFLPPLLGSAGPDGAAPLDGEPADTGTAGEIMAGGVADAVSDPEGAGQETAHEELVDGIAPVPEDFAFSFTWGCYGISSYDSGTGRLVKTTDASHPEDYVTELILDEDQRQAVWLLLSDLALETYPAEYDPYNAPDALQRVASEPNRDLILRVRADGRETTVSCRGICLDGLGVKGYDERARAFLEACTHLERLLTGTPEWAALPDYEVFYE